MNAFLTKAFLNWKSTASGFLTATLATSAALVAYPPIQKHLTVMAILGGVQVVGKVWIALITTDADKVAK